MGRHSHRRIGCYAVRAQQAEHHAHSRNMIRNNVWNRRIGLTAKYKIKITVTSEISLKLHDSNQKTKEHEHCKKGNPNRIYKKH